MACHQQPARFRVRATRRRQRVHSSGTWYGYVLRSVFEKDVFFCLFLVWVRDRVRYIDDPRVIDDVLQATCT
jgi:hypothetical protein